MNLETIQSRMQDIEQLRLTSQENEKAIVYGKGRDRTASDERAVGVSSLSFRFFLAAVILAGMIYADYMEISGASSLIEEISEVISYNIRLEDVENLKEIWYTITDTLMFSVPTT